MAVTVFVLMTFVAITGFAQADPSGASLKTTLQKKAVEECGCEAFVVAAQVAPQYSYKLVSTTNLSLPTEQWIEEFGPVTTLTDTMSWAIPLTSSGNKFFRVVEMGLGAYTSVAIDAASPLPGLIAISATDATHDVPLIVYDVKSHVANSILRNAIFEISADSSTNDISSIFSAVKLKVGGSTYVGRVISTGTGQLFGNNSYGWKVAFSDIAIPLPADASVSMAITADIIAGTNGVLDGIHISAGDGVIDLDVEDPSYRSIIPSETRSLNGTIFTLASQNAFASNMSTSLGAPVANEGGPTAQQFSFVFSLTAVNEPIYLSSASTTSVSIKLAGNVGSLQWTSIVDDNEQGDGTGYFFVAPGATKTFTVNYATVGAPSTVSGTVSVQSINYGRSPADLTEHSIVYGLQRLRAILSF